MTPAVMEINDYLLYDTPIGDLLGFTDETKPIFPIQNIPEADEINPEFPFITYSFRTVTDPSMWWIMVDEVTYVVNSSVLEDCFAVIKELTDIFKRMDESAMDLQEYLISEDRNDFTFHFIRVVSTITPDPTPEEGGRYMWPITIRYQYTTTGRGAI